MFGSNYMNSQYNSMKSQRSGFTLVELMVVIAVIALLVSMVIVALKSSSASSARARSTNSLREMIRGYRAYSDDNRGQLMPGYIGEDLMDDTGDPFENLRVTLPEGFVLSDFDSQSYVWRLAPYVGNVWEVFYAELGDSGIEAQLQSEFVANNYSNIAERPTFGMNSIFVGGDSVHGGAYATDRNPWDPALGLENEILAVTRFTQVKNPARLIVFGSAGKVLQGGPGIYEPTSLGFCELRAPFLDESSGEWNSLQWIVGESGLIENPVTDDDGTGIPIDRHGAGLIPVAFLDGSAAAVKMFELSADMRMWNPRAVGPLGLTPAN